MKNNKNSDGVVKDVLLFSKTLYFDKKYLIKKKIQEKAMKF
jgi:hypothetical protein